MKVYDANFRGNPRPSRIPLKPSINEEREISDGRLLVDQAPHAETLRYEYLIPEQKVFELLWLHIAVFRTVVAGVSARLGITIRYTPKNNSRYEFLRTHTINNSLGQIVFLLAPQSGKAILYGGGKLEIFTFDLSTTGNVDYCVAIHGLERFWKSTF